MPQEAVDFIEFLRKGVLFLDDVFGEDLVRVIDEEIGTNGFLVLDLLQLVSVGIRFNLCGWLVFVLEI